MPVCLNSPLRKDESTCHNGFVSIQVANAHILNYRCHAQMMETLEKEPGSLIEVKNVTLPLGKLVKLQAQSTDFLEITDHRAVYV